MQAGGLIKASTFEPQLSCYLQLNHQWLKFQNSNFCIGNSAVEQGKGMGWVYEEEGQPAPQRGVGGGLSHKSERGSL